GPGNRLRPVDALLFGATVIPFVRWLSHDFPFDLIHAHFTYPDGVVAGAIGRMLHVPTIITEHAPWYPWIQQERLVRAQTIWAARAARFHLSVSESVRRQVVETAGLSDTARVVPNVVDPVVFHPDAAARRVAGQILFVGAIRNCKGVDVLFEALRQPALADPKIQLLIAGEPLYEGYRREVEWLHEQARALGIAHRVNWLGGKTPTDIAALMRQSSAVVLPSRAESFGAVLIEAMACGTPVVATRCGGPEEIVAPQTGRLVEPEQPAALADAIADVLANGGRYNPTELHAYAVGRFGPEVVAKQLSELYAEAVAGPRMSGRAVGIRG
ncbi:MAG: glycosyltransferase, partial [Chloroflexota bacterium]